MKAEFHKVYINLRPENDEERVILKEMWDTGIEVWGGGAYLSFSSKKHRDAVTARYLSSKTNGGNMKDRAYCKDCGIGVTCLDYDPPEGFCHSIQANLSSKQIKRGETDE